MIIHRGIVIELRVEEVSLPNGHSFPMEVVRHPGGAAVVAVNNQRQVCLVHQYRHVAEGMLYELPAGKRVPEEEPLVTAQRELKEEAGVVALEWQAMGSIWSSPGVFSEQIHLYLARDLHITVAQTEPEEFIEPVWIDLAQALNWAKDGIISDAKSIIGLFRAAAIIDVK